MYYHVQSVGKVNDVVVESHYMCELWEEAFREFIRLDGAGTLSHVDSRGRSEEVIVKEVPGYV